MAKQYETVIGLEVHVQQRQKSSADAARHSEEHRIHIHARFVPVCLDHFRY